MCNEKKQLLYKKFLRKPKDKNKNGYCKVQNLYDRVVKSKKQTHIKFKLEENKEENKSNLRATGKLINEIIGKKKQNSTSFISINQSLITEKDML